LNRVSRCRDSGGSGRGDRLNICGCFIPQILDLRAVRSVIAEPLTGIQPVSHYAGKARLDPSAMNDGAKMVPLHCNMHWMRASPPAAL
jgi:hypothetical protein